MKSSLQPTVRNQFPADAVRMLPAGALLDGDQRYDLAIDVHSFTEMDRTGAERCWERIHRRANVALIDQEPNEFSVVQLIRAVSGIASATRFPYWTGRGYPGELVELARP